MTHYPTDKERHNWDVFRALAVQYAEAELRWWDADDNSTEEWAADAEVERLRELYRDARWKVRYMPDLPSGFIVIGVKWHKRVWFRVRSWLR